MLPSCEAFLILGTLISPCDQIQLFELHEPEACVLKTQDNEGHSQEVKIDLPCTKVNQKIWRKKNSLEAEAL